MKSITKVKRFIETEEPSNTKLEDFVSGALTAAMILLLYGIAIRFIQLGLVF